MGELTIKDIAKICNVGTSTVSRAINGGYGIKKETRDHILQVIEEYGFTPNNSARSLKITESNTLAVLVKNMSNQFFQAMFDLFERKLEDLTYSVEVHAVASNENELDKAEELIREKKLKGILLLGGTSSREETDRRLTIPYVRCFGAIDPYEKEDVCVSVGINNIVESYRMTDYLCKKGHKKIAIICRSAHDNSTGELRLQGFKNALADNGVEFDPELVYDMDPQYGDFSMAAGYEATRKLLASGKEFTALFVISDVMTMGAYRALYEAGKRIPEDYSVVGFDGLDMSRYFCPSLTTLKQPVEEVIDAAIESLMAQIAGKESQKIQMFEGTLREGDSVKQLN